MFRENSWIMIIFLIYNFKNLKMKEIIGSFVELERCRGNFPKAKNYIESNQTSEVTVWCSNDYLGMGQNQNVLNAIKKALNECGAGAGELEIFQVQTIIMYYLKKNWQIYIKRIALLFTSGYISNWATLSTLGARLPGCTILSMRKIMHL